MALRLGSLLIALVLMGLLATSMRGRLTGTTPSNSPGTPQNLLRTAGMVVERTHQITGAYTGVGLQGGGSALRLASSDANGYCLEITWIDRQVYHLRGPGGQPASGGC
jgi:hypothetical protein